MGLEVDMNRIARAEVSRGSMKGSSADHQHKNITKWFNLAKLSFTIVSDYFHLSH